MEEEKKADKARMEMLMNQEREMTEKEKELEAEARWNILVVEWWRWRNILVVQYVHMSSEMKLLNGEGEIY